MKRIGRSFFMYLKNISITAYGPIENLSYSFRFDDNKNPIPLVIIGKNGCGKTLIFSNIVDMMVEVKRTLFPSGILEVVENNYYRMGSHSYIHNNLNTSIVQIKYGNENKSAEYIDIISRNPNSAVTNNEITDQTIAKDQKFKTSGFYKHVDLHGITDSDFQKFIQLFFPFDRFYTPMWYNYNNYNRIPFATDTNFVNSSGTNFIKTDILDNIKEWFRTVHLESQSFILTLPNLESIPEELRGKAANIRQDTKLQAHLKQILELIKGDGPYSVNNPQRNNKLIGLQGPSVHCADIAQLSAGELSLYALALSIIKEWDLLFSDDSLELENIAGCVIIDEADANLHIDYAYRALPALMKLFPKVQFIISTHSPFLLAGLKNKYGKDIDILSLPTGELIEDLNSFSEITEAYEVFNTETNNILQQIQSLKQENDRLKGLNEKIIIYTEGKTDVKYLKLALDCLSGFDDIKKQIEFYDIEHAKDTGDGELDRIFTYLQKGNDSNIKICIFDRDNTKYFFPAPFLRGSNNVYKFNIPTPSHRNDGDMISIEHCFTDAALQTTDKNGRRIFLSGDFKSNGISTDGQFVCHHKLGKNPLEILDGSGTKKVYSVPSNDTTKNYALTKDDFVQHIIDKDSGYENFSFEGFRPILEMIRTIVTDAKGISG